MTKDERPKMLDRVRRDEIDLQAAGCPDKNIAPCRVGSVLACAAERFAESRATRDNTSER